MPPFTPTKAELLHLLEHGQALIVRAVDPQPTADGDPEQNRLPTEWFWWDAGEPTESICCPFGEIGAVLWAREAIRCNAEHNNFYYALDSQGVGELRFTRLRDRGGIGRDYAADEMRRDVARLWFRVKSVDCRRVQTITQEEERLAVWVIGKKLETPGFSTRLFACQWGDANQDGEKFEDNPWAWFVHVERVVWLEGENKNDDLFSR